MINKLSKKALTIICLALCLSVVMLNMTDSDLKDRLSKVNEQKQSIKNYIYNIETKDNIARNFADTLENFDIKYKEIID